MYCNPFTYSLYIFQVLAGAKALTYSLPPSPSHKCAVNPGAEAAISAFCSNQGRKKPEQDGPAALSAPSAEFQWNHFDELFRKGKKAPLAVHLLLINSLLFSFSLTQRFRTVAHSSSRSRRSSSSTSARKGGIHVGVSLKKGKGCGVRAGRDGGVEEQLPTALLTPTRSCSWSRS